MSGLMRTYIAGPSHHPGAREAIALMKGGDALTLVREPGNPFDKNAVAVRDRIGLKLGYVPRVDAPAIAKAMDQGYTVGAKVCRQGLSEIEISWDKPNDKNREVTL